MTADGCAYILQAGQSSASCTRTLTLASNNHLHVVATGSLEGWGEISDEFSSTFLDILSQKTTALDQSVLADHAERAFLDALACHKPETPLWSSVQYVAVQIEGDILRTSWIGDMHLIGWKESGKYIVNSPHIVEYLHANGKQHRMILKSLMMAFPASGERKPEVGIPQALERPTVLFLGDGNPELLLLGSQELQQLQSSSDAKEFQEKCGVIDKLLSGSLIRGMFLYV